MKSNTFIILFVFIMLVAGFCLTAPAMQADGERPTRKWEHLSLTHIGFNVDDDLELSKQIVQLGDQGWEMVTVSNVTQDGTTTRTIFYFKRPK